MVTIPFTIVSTTGARICNAAIIPSTNTFIVSAIGCNIPGRFSINTVKTLPIISIIGVSAGAN